MATIWSRYWKLVWELIRKKRNEQFPCVLIAWMSLPVLNKCWPSGADGISLPWRLVPFLSGFCLVLTLGNMFPCVPVFLVIATHLKESTAGSRTKSHGMKASLGVTTFCFIELFSICEVLGLQVTERNGRSNSLDTSGPWFPSLQWQCYGSFGPWEGR